MTGGTGTTDDQMAARHRRTRWWAPLVAVASCLGALAMPAAAASASATGGARVPQVAANVQFSSHTTYRVVPSAGRVDVTVQVTTEQSTAVGFTMLVPEAAGELSVQVDPGGGGIAREAFDLDFDLVTVSYSGGSGAAVSTVSYSLFDGSDPDGWATIVNDAVVSFLVFDGTGAPRGEIEVVLPTGFGPDTGPGERMDRSDDGEEVRFEATSTASRFINYLSTSHADRFRTTVVDVGEHSVEVKAWPSDPEWGRTVAEVLKEGLPTLETTIGIEWQVGDDLVIQQSQAPYLAGYGGWYDPESDVIELGEQWDAHLLLHEVSHTWFHDDMFDERWITEGLADTYATLTLEAMGVEARRPDTEQLEITQVVPLSEWGDAEWRPGLDEYWAYEASWATMLEIHAQVGSAAMEDAMRVALESVVAYRPDPSEQGIVIEPGRNTRDWRYFLDVLDNAARRHRPSADLDPIFLDHVVGANEDEPWAEVLAERAEVRELYFDLDEADGGWSTPLGVRLYLGAWDFGEARSLILEARATVDTVDEALVRFAEQGIAVPNDLEQAYAEAEFGLGEVEQALVAAEQAIDNAMVGEALLDEPRSFTTRVGLWWGPDVDGLREPLREAATRGDGIEADRIATQIARDLRSAESSGMIRLMVVAMFVLLPVPVALYLRREADAEVGDLGAARLERPTAGPLPDPVGMTRLADLADYVRPDPATTEPPAPAPDAPIPPLAPVRTSAVPAPDWAAPTAGAGAIPDDVRAALAARLSDARSDGRRSGSP